MGCQLTHGLCQPALPTLPLSLSATHPPPWLPLLPTCPPHQSMNAPERPSRKSRMSLLTQFWRMVIVTGLLHQLLHLQHPWWRPSATHPTLSLLPQTEGLPIQLSQSGLHTASLTAVGHHTRQLPWRIVARPSMTKVLLRQPTPHITLPQWTGDLPSCILRMKEVGLPTESPTT